MTLSKNKKSKQFRKNQSGGKEDTVDESKCNCSLLCDLQSGKIKPPKLFKLTFEDKDEEEFSPEVCFHRYTDEKDDDGIVCRYMRGEDFKNNKCPEGGDYYYYFKVNRTDDFQKERNLIINVESLDSKVGGKRKTKKSKKTNKKLKKKTIKKRK